MSLNPRRERFVQEYLIDLNGTQAAIRAGYSAKTAASIAEEILRKPEIRSAIAKAKAERAEKTGITAERVLSELAAIGFADTTQAIQVKRGKVTITDTANLSEDTRRAIAEIKQTTNVGGGGSIAIKFHDKKGSLQLLGQHLGIFENEDDGPETPAPTVVNVKIVDGRKA